MEPRSNPALVGSFVIGFFLLFLFFVLWFSRATLGQEHSYYDIYFSGSVSGLQEGSTVKYRGVPVGVVSQIELDPMVMEKILVRIDVRKNIKLKQDVFAYLDTQPLTGVSTVQLSGGTQEAPDLIKTENQLFPQIPSRSSFLDQVVDSVPALLNRVSSLTDYVKGFLTPENQSKTKEILINLESLSHQMTEQGRMKKTLEAIEVSAKKLNLVLDTIQKTAKDVSQISTSSKNVIEDISGVGFIDLSQLVQETTSTLASLKRISEALEKSPTRFLTNDPATSGVKLPFKE